MPTCIRCGTDAPDNFCPHCGQKQNIPRLNWKTLLHDFSSRIYGIDGAFPQTVKGLFKQPGVVIQEYIDGVRNKYVGPVGYYFLLFTIYAFLFKILGINMVDYMSPESFSQVIQEFANPNNTEQAIEARHSVMENMVSMIQFVPILIFPFWAWFAKAFFRTRKFNFLEHIVFAFYANGQTVLFSILSLLIFKITGEFVMAYEQLANTIFICIAALVFYEQKVSFKGMMKASVVYLLAFIAYFVAFSVIASLAYYLDSVLFN